MRHLERLPKPNILSQKDKEWTDKFIESGKTRPDNSKYGHKDIITDLNAISFHKCFYSEQKLKGIPREIDHHIEVSERKDLAYDWDNLYLSSTECNNKLPNKIISVSDVLNPFNNSDEEFESHFIFENEFVTARNGSELALNTIKKYRLDSPLLDSLRSAILHQFKDVLEVIRKNQISENGRVMNDIEIEALRRFAQPDHSFSLMFRLLLKKHNL
jgi:hypothetical protein